MALSPEILARLATITGEDGLLSDPADC